MPQSGRSHGIEEEENVTHTYVSLNLWNIEKALPKIGSHYL